jgi:hypothetical protein
MNMVTYGTFPPTIIFRGASCILRVLRHQADVIINSSFYFFISHGLDFI